MTDLELRSVIKFLWIEEVPGPEIQRRLSMAYGDSAYSLTSVYRWIRLFKCGRTNVEDDERSGRPPIDDLDASIIHVLNHDPFSTVRVIADNLGVSVSTVYRRLTISLGLKSYLCKWVPHFLTEELRQKRLTLAQQLLSDLETEEPFRFQRIITGDESWFYIDYSPTRIWSLSPDNLPQNVSHAIQSQKFMLTVFWGISGPVLIKWLKPGEKFNTTYFINDVIAEMFEVLRKQGRLKDKPWLRLHMDNARPHNSKDSTDFIERHKFVRMPHPPYSPDLAPSDFYLFGTIKDRLRSIQGHTAEELFQNVEEILNAISGEEIERVFLDWMERCRKVIASNGDYIT